MHLQVSARLPVPPVRATTLDEGALLCDPTVADPDQLGPAPFTITVLRKWVGHALLSCLFGAALTAVPMHLLINLGQSRRRPRDPGQVRR